VSRSPVFNIKSRSGCIKHCDLRKYGEYILPALEINAPEVSTACYFVTMLITSRIDSKFISFWSIQKHAELGIYCIIVAWFTVRDNSPCILVGCDSV